MGNSFEVYEWAKIGECESDWDYKLYWSGESLENAMEKMHELKANGCGCAKLEWR